MFAAAMFAPSEEVRPAPRGARPALRLVLAALAILAAAGALAQHHAEVADRAALIAQASELGIARADSPSTFARLDRESSAARRRIVLARRLIDLELARGRAGASTGRELERLEAARRLAREALAREPASWEGAMLDGAATAMLRLRRRDTRLFSAAADWERPLLAATGRFPAGAEPRRFLAAAYLEVWPALAPARRPAVERLLREAFEDDRFFDLLLGRWLEIAGSFERAIPLLPDRPRVWRTLGEAALRRGDFASFRLFRDREREALARDFEAAIERRAKRSADPAAPVSALEELSSIVVEAPLDGAFAPLVDRALGLRPAGPASHSLAEASRRWIEWSLPLCLLRTCPLGPAAIARLASLAGAALTPESDAFAAVAADDWSRAERLARRSDSLWSEAWAPYLTFAARRRLASGDSAGALALLAQVHRPSRTRLATRLVARTAGARDFGVEGEPAATSWEPSEWREAGGARALELLPARSGTLVARLHAPVSRPSLVLVELDGGTPQTVELAVGSTELRFPGRLAAEPHLVRVRPLVGGLPPFDLTTID
jgi:hypothetical protein